MKDDRTIKRGAVRTAPVGLAGLAGRTLAGAVALLLVSAVFGGRAWAIVGGGPDESRHPNVGAVIQYDPLLGIVPSSCVLVNERVVLTAGHVVDAILSGEVVLLGVSFDEELVVGSLAPLHTVKGVVSDYGWSANGNANPKRADIGALILEEGVTDIEPAALPAASFLDELVQAGQLWAGPDGPRLTLVGYGLDLSFPPPEFFSPYEIVDVEYDGQTVPFMGGGRNTAQSGYLGLNAAWLRLSQNVATGSGGTQPGDSGGPVFWTDPSTGDEVLVAITSWGPLVGTGCYYRVDTAKSLSFIQSVIDSLAAE